MDSYVITVVVISILFVTQIAMVILVKRIIGERRKTEMLLYQLFEVEAKLAVTRRLSEELQDLGIWPVNEDWRPGENRGIVWSSRENVKNDLVVMRLLQKGGV